MLSQSRTRVMTNPFLDSFPSYQPIPDMSNPPSPPTSVKNYDLLRASTRSSSESSDSSSDSESSEKPRKPRSPVKAPAPKKRVRKAVYQTKDDKEPIRPKPKTTAKAKKEPESDLTLSSEKPEDPRLKEVEEEPKYAKAPAPAKHKLSLYDRIPVEKKLEVIEFYEKHKNYNITAKEHELSVYMVKKIVAMSKQEL